MITALLVFVLAFTLSKLVVGIKADNTAETFIWAAALIFEVFVSFSPHFVAIRG